MRGFFLLRVGDVAVPNIAREGKRGSGVRAADALDSIVLGALRLLRMRSRMISTLDLI